MEMEVKQAVDGLMTSFEAFKATNDARLAQVEAKGAVDPVTEGKLRSIEATLSSYDAVIQKAAGAAQLAEVAEKQSKAALAAIEALELKGKRPGAGGDRDKLRDEYKAAAGAYFRRGENGMSADERKTADEYKVLVASNDTLGGYYLSPAQMEADIIKAVVLQSPFRGLARSTTIGVATLQLPRRTGVFAAVRIGETATRTETTGYTTGLLEIKADEIYAEVRISTQMMEDSAFDIEAEMQMEFVEQFAVKEGAEFINGTGVTGQAEGVMTAAGTNSVNSGNATGITADGMMKLFYEGLKTAYAANAVFIMNRKSLGAIRRLKSGDGNYLWTPGIPGNVPNTIIGAPYAEMPDMPDEGAGLFPVAVGDWKRGYRIVDRVSIQVLRDAYTVANVGQVLYRARRRFGGAVVLAEAIAKLKCSV